MTFLQQDVQGYLTCLHRRKEVMVNVNKMQSMYNKLCLSFTIIISPDISYALSHSKNWFRQLHCYFVNNFTTTFVTFTSFIENSKNIKNFQKFIIIVVCWYQSDHRNVLSQGCCKFAHSYIHPRIKVSEIFYPGLHFFRPCVGFLKFWTITLHIIPF